MLSPLWTPQWGGLGITGYKARKACGPSQAAQEATEDAAAEGGEGGDSQARCGAGEQALPAPSPQDVWEVGGSGVHGAACCRSQLISNEEGRKAYRQL